MPPGRILGTVDTNSTPFIRLVPKVIPDSHHQLIPSITVQVGPVDRVSPLETIVQYFSIPGLVGIFGVGNHLVAMPGFDGADAGAIHPELAPSDFTGTP